MSFGPNVTVSSVTRVSGLRLTTRVSVSGGAAIGARDVTIVNPDGGTGMCAGCFTVNPLPTISSVTRNDSTSLTIDISVADTAAIGARNLVVANVDGGTVTCAGVQVVSVIASATTITLSVTIAAGATRSARDVTVVNPRWCGRDQDERLQSHLARSGPGFQPPGESRFREWRTARFARARAGIRAGIARV